MSRPRAWFISSLGLEWASSSFLATTGITQAETAGVPELEDLRTAIVEEALAVAAAKGVTLEYPDPLPNIRAHVASKRTKPSMLQHIEAGRRTEIDAIIGGDYYMAPDSIPMKTGDILLFHKLTFHSSRENRTQRARWNVDIRFMANPACRILSDEEREAEKFLAEKMRKSKKPSLVVQGNGSGVSWKDWRKSYPGRIQTLGD